jgi:hypothetical protein
MPGDGFQTFIAKFRGGYAIPEKVIRITLKFVYD